MFQNLKLSNITNKGFTLLEVMIAMGIMVVTFGAVLMVQSGSLTASERARQMNAVAMLAKNSMIDTELAIEGKGFKEVKSEESGQYDPPYDQYRWNRKIKEIKFPNLIISSGEDESIQPQAEMLGKLMSKFLSDAIREINVTVTWQRGKGTQSYSISTYWVDLNHEFSIKE